MRKLLPLVLVLGLTGCGSDSAADGALTVVASTPVVADLARSVTGDDVPSIVPANADPHEYELRPEDAEALAEADVVLRSGGDLDEWLSDAIDAAGSGAKVVTVGAQEQDPHWWHDPREAIEALERIGRATGDDAAEAIAEIRTLDIGIERCVATIPVDRRKLVTTHDALGFFARRYGFEVVGTVIPSLSTRGQPSAGDVARLVKDVRAAGVRTIFPEASVSAKVEQAIARAAGVEVGPELQADTLGEGLTYVEAMRANTRAIVEGLGGRCDI